MLLALQAVLVTLLIAGMKYLTKAASGEKGFIKTFYTLGAHSIIVGEAWWQDRGLVDHIAPTFGNQRVNRKGFWAIKPQGQPPVTHFLHQGPLPNIPQPFQTAAGDRVLKHMCLLGYFAFHSTGCMVSAVVTNCYCNRIKAAVDHT